MSIDFLKSIYSELLQEKTELELEQSNIIIKQKENEKYIKRFQKEEEENYDAFSPRNQNSDLKNRIHSFENKKNALLKRSEEIELKLDDLTEKINGFDYLFQEEKEQKEILKKYAKRKKKIRKLQEAYMNDLSTIKCKLEFCFQLIEVDPQRCRLELSSLNNMITEKIENSDKDHQKMFEIDEGGLNIDSNSIDDRR